MLFLYSLPSTGMAAIVVSAIVAVVLAGYAVARRFALIELDAEQRAMAVSMVSIITTINSLLVAFAAINVWDTYNAADRTVAAEATAAGELARDLAAFDSSAADAAAAALRTYLVMVVHDEWPRMQRQGKPDPHTEQRFDQMFDLANRIRPLDSRQTVLLGEVLMRVNEMVKYRQQRILTLHAAMPNTLWGVIVIVSALSFALLYVLPATPFNLALITAWAITIGLAFFFLLAVDRPFAGEFSVGADPLQHTIDTLVANGTWPATQTEPQPEPYPTPYQAP